MARPKKKTASPSATPRRKRTDYSTLPSVTKQNITVSYLNGVRTKGLKETLLRLDDDTIVAISSFLNDVAKLRKQKLIDEKNAQLKAIQEELAALKKS